MSLPPSLWLGPLVIASERLLALLLITAFLLFATCLARRTGSVERTGMLATAFGLLAARAGFVAANWESFRQEPWSVLAFWQGGFSLVAGVAVAVATLLVLGWTRWRIAAAQVGAVAALTSLYLASESLMALPARPLPRTITLVSLDGRAVPTGALRGQPAVINLWATWCPPCRREMPMLIEEAARSPVPILLVNQGEDEKTVRDFLRSEGLADERVFLDPTGSLGDSSGSPALPTTLFVDATGQVRATHVGEISRAALAQGSRQLALEVLLEGPK